MLRVIDIALKDLLQMLRDRKIFLFLLIMPVIFTLLFGFAFGGFGGGDSDSRIPVGFINADTGWLSGELQGLLEKSDVIRLEVHTAAEIDELEQKVLNEDLPAALIIPAGYSHALLEDETARLILIGDTSSPVGTTIKSAALTAANRVNGAVHTALIMERVAGDEMPFDYAFDQTLSAWEEPPIQVTETTSSAIEEGDGRNESLAHTSPGMMLQFAIAGLLTSAQVIVSERRSRSLQRLFTTATRRVHVLIGHYLAIFTITISQFLILLVFGQFILSVNYLRDPAATLLTAFCAALCIASMGVLIGVLAKTEEQAIIFALLPMFIFAGLGGAWVPLEVTGPTFQTIGHLSPIAWAMDGFKNISTRGLGIESVLLPCAALLGYALVFFVLAAWRMQVSQE
jgi:ABC-2 type transport system permease protein